MAFISVSDELANKSFTSVENKFITKYLPVLEPVAVKVYLYSLYVYQNEVPNFSAEDLAERLNLTREQLTEYYQYLEESELVSVISLSPLEVKIMDAENVYGTPKKFKPEKYADFTKTVQQIIKGRMISTNEFREYFLLIEEYGFEQNALIMVINYCVNLKGDNIRLQYIKKVAKSFADDGATTAKKVDEKLSAYTFSTPALLRIFRVAGINKQPDIDDDKFYKKWTTELGFEEPAISAAAKSFKIKSTEKLDEVLTELYKNKKFDVKEIEDYCKNKSSVYSATIEIARSLGVYMQNSAPYIDNYVNVWCDYGFTLNCLKTLANYCFKNNKKSFEDMHTFVNKLYKEGIVNDESVSEELENLDHEEQALKELLSVCGLTRKVIDWDRECLARWKAWGFNGEMLTEAAKLSAGKSNPMAYMNSVLSTWKTEGTFSPECIKNTPRNENKTERGEIERHYAELRHRAEDAAERAYNAALADETYEKIHRDLNELNIQLAFAEIRNSSDAEKIADKISELNILSEKRLSELGIAADDFTPHYSCKICNDTGYDKNGKPCACLKKFISSL